MASGLVTFCSALSTAAAAGVVVTVAVSPTWSMRTFVQSGGMVAVILLMVAESVTGVVAPVAPAPPPPPPPPPPVLEVAAAGVE